MKELEELKDLKNAFVGHCKELGCDENYIKVCENKFSKIEKEIKALDFVRKHTMYLKNVNTFVFIGMNVSVIEQLKEILL